MNFKIFKTVYWLPVIILAAFSCAPRLPRNHFTLPLEDLRIELNQILNEPDLSNANWGVVVQSLDNGQYLYLHDADKRFLPASNMKLLTTSAGLAKLGPDFCYHTFLYTDGDISLDGILNGNLILVGSGDPTFGSRYFDSPGTKIFEAWADSLISLGITSIVGNIIGDDNIFSEEIMGTGWAWDDESDYYSAQIGGICFFENCVNIWFAANDTLNARAAFRLEPTTDYLTIYKNDVRIVAPEQESYLMLNRIRGTNRVQVEGTLPKREQEYQDWVTVDNPTLYAVTVLKKTLQDKNIRIHGIAIDSDDLPNFTYQKQKRIASFTSPPLTEIVRTINKISQNLYAEQLLRTLGAQFFQVGSFDNARKALKDFLITAGNNADDIRIADGSGLSRKNLISPRQIVTLLRYIDKQPYGPTFYESLPVAGIDGTLKNRMLKTRAEKNVHAKTGTLENVRCLSGYITTADDEKLAFSILTNNFMVPVSVATRVQDLVCERLANFTKKR